MKRFHVHLAVADLAASIDFYTRLFAQAPDKRRDDYARWMLDDPRLNFAISARGRAPGVNHLGIQAGCEEDLVEIRARADSATAGATVDQAEAACCYAKGIKHWAVDPQGVAWEHYLTLADAEVFGEDTAASAGVCCLPGESVQKPDAGPLARTDDDAPSCCG